MNPVPLYFVWNYNDLDHAFWAEHLAEWLPEKIIDAHAHVSHADFCLEPVTEEMRRQYWVNELSEPIDPPTADKCLALTFPGKKVKYVAFAYPSLAYDIEAANEYTRAECLKRSWGNLAVLRPQLTAEQAAAELAKPGVLGFKPYYSLISHDRSTRDVNLEAGIFDFLPHHILEVLDERRAWVTLHVPKAGRLPHPDNIRDIKRIRKRYPNIILVIAHLGRCYTEPHAREGLPPLADDPGLYFDNSAVFNPAVHRLAFELLGPERILYGTDNPIFYMRGRRQWRGRNYVNRTDYPFYFNREREAPEIEATYTLYMYEALKTIKDVCEEFGFGPKQVRAIFHDNAARLIEKAKEKGK